MNRFYSDKFGFTLLESNLALSLCKPLILILVLFSLSTKLSHMGLETLETICAKACVLKASLCNLAIMSLV